MIAKLSSDHKASFNYYDFSNSVTFKNHFIPTLGIICIHVLSADLHLIPVIFLLNIPRLLFCGSSSFSMHMWRSSCHVAS